MFGKVWSLSDCRELLHKLVAFWEIQDGVQDGRRFFKNQCNGNILVTEIVLKCFFDIYLHNLQIYICSNTIIHIKHTFERFCIKNVSFYWYFCIYLGVVGGIIVVVFYIFQQMSIMFCYLYSLDMGKHKLYSFCCCTYNN